MPGLQAHYAAPDIEARILAAIRAAGIDPQQPLAPKDLGALDHFHTGGVRATRALLDEAHIGRDDRVLDLGAGLAGPARYIASRVGCRVDCVELSADFCAGARLLNRLTGLDDRIHVHQGSVLDLPFADGSFDVVWMQNVGMNIADKDGLYAQVARVLRPEGRFAFQELVSGSAPVAYFPLPWATDPADSFLAAADDVRAMLVARGFILQYLEDATAAHLGSPDAPPGALSLGAFVDNVAEKAANARRSMDEGQCRLVRGVFRRA